MDGRWIEISSGEIKNGWKLIANTSIFQSTFSIYVNSRTVSKQLSANALFFNLKYSNAIKPLLQTILSLFLEFFHLALSMLGKISADDTLKFFCFPQKIGFYFAISCKLSPKEKIPKNSLSLFSGKIIINLSSAKLAQRTVKVKLQLYTPRQSPLQMPPFLLTCAQNLKHSYT